MRGKQRKTAQDSVISEQPLLQSPLMERMEPRILLSADFPGLDAGSLDHDPDGLNTVLTPTDAEAPRLVPASLTTLGARDGDTADQEAPPPVDALYLDNAPDTDTPDALDALDATATSDDVRQVLIIDGSLSDSDTLIRDFLDDSQAGIDQVFILDPEQDGVAQVADILGQLEGLESAHIVSHAHSGELFLGSSTLSNASLATHAGSLADWGKGLSADGDILLYGCDLASDTDGRALIDKIAALTGADVAASDDLTGHTERGGDWDLEYHAGSVDSWSFGTATAPAWDGVLGSVTVTFTGDVLDGDADTSSLAALQATPGADGQVSLREAIIAANNDNGTDTINLAAGTFTLGIAATNEDAALDGDLDIDDDLVIRGAGVGSTTIDGAGVGRVLDIHGSAVVDIADLTIANGNALNEDASGKGGGARVEAGTQLFLNNVMVQNNTAVDGGGLRVNGYLQADNLSVYSNTATDDGGGLHVRGLASILGATFHDNTASDTGGAIRVGNSGQAEFLETTLSANSAGTLGGGLYNNNIAVLYHATVVDNTAVSEGGGLYNNTGFWDFQVYNSIVADNAAPTNPDAAGSFLSDGENLVRTPGTAFGFASDLTGVDPLLGGLADNGGPTETHALLAGSPAIDAVGFTNSTVDQRGYARPVGAFADMGAYEYLAAPAPSAPTAAADGYSTNEDTTLAVDAAGGVLANDTDPESDPLSAYVTDGPDNGVLVLSPTGLLNETNITGDADIDTDPVYSPDGNRIAFASDRSGALEIHLMDADGSNVVQLTSLGANSSWPSWSPDGTQLVFQTDGDGNNELYLINADGTGLTRLTNDAANDAQPAWSPDGTQIAFRSDRDGNNEIYVINVDGTGLTRLTNDADADRAPTWSPDGSRIAFTTDRDGDFNIYTMNSDGTGLFQVTTTAGDDRAPGYSPDGSKIAFASGADGDFEISVINTDGTGLVQLTSNTDEDMSPYWSPDGSTLIFRSDRDGNQEIHTTSLLFDGSFDYIPNSNFYGVDSFTYVANDGGLNSNPAIATLTVDSVNDIPIVGNNIITLDQGSTVTLDSNMLSATDVDHSDGNLSFTVSGVSNGWFADSGAPSSPIFTFTQDEVTAGTVVFVHDGGELAPSFDISVSDGTNSTASVAGGVAFSDTASGVLWLSTKGDEGTGNGVPGLDSAGWDEGDLLQMAGPDFVLGEAATDGNFSLAFDPTNFGTDANINGLHFVTTSVTIGSGGNAITLQVGDIILSTSNSKTFVSNGTVPEPDLSVSKDDIFYFRPDTTGDYTKGNFYRLLDDPFQDGAEVRGLTLVEKDVWVGDRLVTQGDLLLARSGAAEDNDIWLLETATLDPSNGLTYPAAQQLIEGDDAGVDFDQKIYGLDILENDAIIGGQAMDAGTLLVAFENDDNDGIGSTFQVVTKHDIAAFSTTKTTLVSGTGNAQINATLLFDGNDVNFEAGSEAPDAFTLTSDDVAVNVAPSFDTATLTLDEGETVTLDSTMLSASDGNDADAGLVYNVSSVSGGQFELDSNPNVEILNFTQAQVDAGEIVFVDDGNEAGPSINLSVTDGVLATGPVALAVNFTNVNDEQSLDTNSGPTVAEASTGNVISSAMLDTSDVDNTADEITYTVTSVPGNGTLRLSGTALALNDTFTQDDIDSNLVTYDHDGSETTSDSFDFSVDDLTGNATTGSFTIGVNPVNDSDPVADNESFSVVQGGTATQAALDVGGSLLHGDSDADLPNDSLSVNTTPVAGPSHGTLILNADGTFSYTHDDSENLSDSFTYEVVDANGATDTATVTITVTPLPPPAPEPEPEPEPEGVAVVAPEMPEMMVVAEPSEVAEPDSTETADETEETEESDDKEEKRLGEGLGDSAAPEAAAATEEDSVEGMGVDLDLAPTIASDGKAAGSAKFQINGLPMFGSIQPVSFLSGDALSREIRNIMVSEQFGQELDRMRDEISGPSLFYQNAIGTGAAATTTLSIGYVAWMLRGGVLLSTALSSLPAWQFVDPLPVLARTENTDNDSEGDDSLEGIIRNGQGETEPEKVDGKDSTTY